MYKLNTTVPSRICVGDTFRIIYTINYRGEERFIEPAFRELDVVDGPKKSLNIKESVVEGKLIKEPTTIYYYELKARRAGTFNITPAYIIIDGAAYSSSVLSITAVDSGISSRKNIVSDSKSSVSDTTSHSNQINKSTSKNNSIDYFPLFILIAVVILILAFVVYGEHISKSSKDSCLVEAQDSVLSDEEPVYDDVDSVVEEEFSKNVPIEEEDKPYYEEVYFRTGDKPYQAFYGAGKYDNRTKNSLRIKNGSSCDALVFLETLNGKKTRHVYIRKDDTFTMTQIPSGRYIIKIMQGNSWNPDKYNGEDAPKGGFMENVSMSKSENYDPFDYPSPDSGGYYEYEVTLYKVTNGNLHTKAISSSDMF